MVCQKLPPPAAGPVPHFHGQDTRETLPHRQQVAPVFFGIVEGIGKLRQ
jgi:hypothetical protein